MCNLLVLWATIDLNFALSVKPMSNKALNYVLSLKPLSNKAFPRLSFVFRACLSMTACFSQEEQKYLYIKTFLSIQGIPNLVAPHLIVWPYLEDKNTYTSKLLK